MYALGYKRLALGKMAIKFSKICPIFLSLMILDISG